MTEAATTTPNNMAALYAALAAAQGEFLPIEKNRTGQDGNRKFPYADLEEIIKKTRPALVTHGLAVIQYPRRANEKEHELVTVLAHKDGGTMESAIKIPDSGEIKKFGGAISYLRRYAYQSLVCVFADEDFDGMVEDGAPEPQAGVVKMPQRRQNQEQINPVQASNARAQHQQQAEQTGDPASKLQVTAGEFKWLDGKINALGTTWEDAYKRAGLPFDPADPQPVTKAHFTLLKAVL